MHDGENRYALMIRSSSWLISAWKPKDSVAIFWTGRDGKGAIDVVRIVSNAQDVPDNGESTFGGK
jgi:hypothetical protein